jgi:hypothetical protein
MVVVCGAPVTDAALSPAQGERIAVLVHHEWRLAEWVRPPDRLAPVREQRSLRKLS